MNFQALTFTLGKEFYGIDILRIREIRSWEPVSRIPNVPSYEKGVINLRGTIVPIIDLRERFGFEMKEYTVFTVVIVLQVYQENKEKIIGVIVDMVSNVVDIDDADLQKTPDFGSRINIEFINSMASINQQMVMILDVDKLLELN